MLLKSSSICLLLGAVLVAVFSLDSALAFKSNQLLLPWNPGARARDLGYGATYYGPRRENGFRMGERRAAKSLPIIPAYSGGYRNEYPVANGNRIRSSGSELPQSQANIQSKSERAEVTGGTQKSSLPAPVSAVKTDADVLKDADLVQIENGVLRGKSLTSRNGLSYKGFLGIRYGTIPCRFAVAVPSSGWEEVQNATEFGSECSQYVFGTTTQTGTEDCLFLNVYTPKADNKKRAVLVYFHGGGLTSGSGNTFGANYLIDEDVVFVTLNYRLGIFGFLNLLNEDATGNMGLKDQVLALKWVQQNIGAFGGDPKKVTIIGESAGGESVVHLILSPLAKGLFRSAWAQSGSALVPSTYKDSSIETAFKAGRYLGLFTESVKELAEFLKTKSEAELLEAQGAFAEWNGDPSGAFPVTLEVSDESNPEPFYPDTPRNLARSGRFNRVPLVLITNKEEGSLLKAATLIRDPKMLKDLNVNFERVAPITLGTRDDPSLKGRNAEEIAKQIRKFYFNNQEITLSKEKELTDLYTDARILHGVHETAVKLSKYAPVYTAVMTHKRKDYSILGIPELLGKITTHLDDLQYVYSGAALGPDISLPDDIKFSKGFVKIIASFAKTGIPEVRLGKSPTWRPVSKYESQTAQLNWLKLNLNPEVLVNPFEARMGFWDYIYRNRA